MKKILYSLVIFVGLFIFVDKVSAFELISPSYTMKYYSSSYISENFNASLTRVPTNLTYGQATYNYIINSFLVNELWKEYGEYYFCFGQPTAYASSCFISNNPDVFTVALNSSIEKGPYIYVNPLSDNEVYQYIISSGSKSSGSGYNSSRKYAGNMYSPDYYIKTNVPYFRVYEPNYETIVTSDGYYFNNDDIFIYLDNGSYVVNTEYKTSLTPEPNIFDEEVNDINYSKMIFNFSQEELESYANLIDMTYKFETIGNIDDNGNLLSEDSSITFLEPYIEYTLNGIKNYLYLSDSNNGHNNPSNIWEIASCPLIPIGGTEVKLIVPMSSTDNVRYRINLSSLVNFEVSYEYDEDLQSYYEEIDLSNKYGVMFMPKLVDNNASVYAIFEFGGIESISIYDTYDYKQQPIEVYSDLNSSISFKVDRELIEYNIFFKSEQKPLRSLVKYDTRYFTYKIVDSKYSVGSVINPNTGENHYVDFSNTANLSSNFSNMSDIFEFISSQLDAQSEAYVLFQGSVNAFFNTMPSELYVVILTLFAIILLGVTLGLGGWR